MSVNQSMNTVRYSRGQSTSLPVHHYTFITYNITCTGISVHTIQNVWKYSWTLMSWTLISWMLWKCQSDLKVSTCVSVCFSTSRNLRYQLKFFLGLIEFEMIEVWLYIQHYMTYDNTYNRCITIHKTSVPELTCCSS